MTIASFYREEITTAEEARQAAIEWSHADTDGLSWGEVAFMGAFFAELAIQFPELAEEFRENGII